MTKTNQYLLLTATAISIGLLASCEKTVSETPAQSEVSMNKAAVKSQDGNDDTNNTVQKFSAEDPILLYTGGKYKILAHPQTHNMKSSIINMSFRLGSDQPLDPKCYSTIPISPPIFNHNTTKFVIIGIDIDEEGQLLRKKIPGWSDPATGIGKVLHDAHKNSSSANGYTKLREEIGKFQSNSMTNEQLNQIDPKRTPFYNMLDNQTGAIHWKIHYVLLDESIRFSETNPAIFHVPAPTPNTFYSPYYKGASLLEIKSNGNHTKESLRVMTISFFRGGNIGRNFPSDSEDRKKYECNYPYDIGIVSNTFDSSRNLVLKTPMIIDPENGSKGPP